MCTHVCVHLHVHFFAYVPTTHYFQSYSFRISWVVSQRKFDKFVLPGHLDYSWSFALLYKTQSHLTSSTKHPAGISTGIILDLSTNLGVINILTIFHYIYSWVFLILL